MTERPHPGPSAPDNPARRLPWVLALAALLVLLALLGLGRVLRAPTRPAHKPKPLAARIYELPASPASQAAKPTPQVQHSAPARKGHPHANATTPHVSSQKGVALAPSHHPAKSSGQKSIRWTKLQSQIDSAVRKSTPSLPQTHDPNTLVAHYYMASLLLKMQRIGDLNYPTNLTGTPVIDMVIGSHGQLLKAKLVRSSGNDTLDHDALQIVHESAPFAPFPDSLSRQTSHIEVVCHMNFEGYRQIYAGE